MSYKLVHGICRVCRRPFIVHIHAGCRIPAVCLGRACRKTAAREIGKAARDAADALLALRAAQALRNAATRREMAVRGKFAGRRAAQVGAERNVRP